MDVLALSGVAVVTILLMTHHFLVTALHVMPVNPLRVATADYVLRYLSPLFEQRWTLFAPNPGRPDYFVLAACRLDAAGTVLETTATDATLHLLDANRRHLFAPAQRIARLMMAGPAMMDLNEVEKEALSFVDSEDPVIAAAARDHLRSVEEHERSLARVLARTASVECARANPGRTIREVRASVVWVTLPPFSKRHDRSFAPQVERTDFEWAKFESVAPYWRE